MLNFLVRRLLATVPVLVGISFISFMLLHLSGDPTDYLLPVDVPEATRRGIRIGNTPGVLTEATADIAFALLILILLFRPAGLLGRHTKEKV